MPSVETVFVRQVMAKTVPVVPLIAMDAWVASLPPVIAVVAL